MKDEIRQYENFLITKQLRKSTIKHYLWHLDKFFVWLEDKNINDATLKQYLDYLLTQYEKANSINLQLIILNAYLKFINYNFSFQLLTSEQKNIKYLDKIELEKLLDTPLKNISLIGLRDKVLLEILYSSGLKVNAVSKITLDDINWNKKVFLINNKTIKIGMLAWPFLKKYINKRNDNNPFLFINFDRSQKANDKALSIRSIERILDKYARNLKPPIKVNPQILRNTLAKDLKRKITSEDEIKKTLSFQTSAATKKYLKEL